MPKPVYILCAESGAEDRITGLVSHFNVIEQIELREYPRPPEGMAAMVQPLSMQVTAAWMRVDGDDPSQQYELKLSVFLPPDGKEVLVGSDTIVMDKLRYRATAYVKGLLMSNAGSFRAESRLRPVGSGDDSWLVQTYEVAVLYIKLDATDSQVSLPLDPSKVNGGAK
jgi:hypothetical protein